jgi:hypothetical protein
MEYMEQQTKKVNKAKFWIGIAIVAIAVILFLTVKEELFWMGLVPLAIMGIVFIGTSGYRPLKAKV